MGNLGHPAQQIINEISAIAHGHDTLIDLIQRIRDW